MDGRRLRSSLWWLTTETLCNATRLRNRECSDESAEEGDERMRRIGVLTLAALAVGCATSRLELDPAHVSHSATPNPIPALAATAGAVSAEPSPKPDAGDEILPASYSRNEASVDIPAPESVTKPTADRNFDSASNAPQTSVAAPPEPRADDVPPAPALSSGAQPPGTEYSTSTDEVVDGRAGDENLSLDGVISSVYQSYPLLEAALFSRNIAAGEQLAAAGAMDLKFKAASENGPTGFYQTYRQSVGLIQPLYHGGEAFAGYRIGRGDFQPWYQERQTNDGGEFKAGIAVPLGRNRHIDARRAELWRSSYERKLVEPEIQAQLIGFVQDAGYAYWDWVAAGAYFQIADRVLSLADERTERIRRQVEVELIDPPELTDNLRLVAERLGKRADAARKLQQAAVKLSLYYRTADGNPLIPDPAMLPDFPEPLPISPEDVSLDTQLALQQRPETFVLNFIKRQLEVDYAEAHNDFRPSVDAVLSGSQDTGEPTSSKNDKGQFELDASIYVDVPIQRRKARGKMQAIEGKISQLNAKRRITEDKIVADVQLAYAGLNAAYEQVIQARQAVAYAEDLAARERRNFEEGLSDLLKVTLREQYAAESAEKAVDALLMYHRAQADYRAALALDRLQ